MDAQAAIEAYFVLLADHHQLTAVPFVAVRYEEARRGSSICTGKSMPVQVFASNE